MLSAGGVTPDRYARSMLGAMQISLFGTARADVVLGLMDRKKGVAMRLERMRLVVRSRPLRPVTLIAGVLAAFLFVLPMGASNARPGDTPTASDQEAETAQQPEAVMEPAFVTEIDGRLVYRFIVGGPVAAPVKKWGPNPEYTPEAREARIQGVVVLQAMISEQGEVTSTKVVRGLPLGLTEAAEAAISRWIYEPARLDGRPVPVLFIVMMRFELNPGEGTLISGVTQVGDDENASEERQRLRDLLAAMLEREIAGDIRVVRIDIGDRQLLMTVVAPGRSSIEAFAARLGANPGFDEVELRTMDDREDGSVEAKIVLHLAPGD